MKNRTFYGHSPLYPYCNAADETMAHIFSCPHEAAMESRKTALSAYKSSLIAKQTSVDLVEEIVRGITERITLGTHAPSPNPETSHAAVVQQQELARMGVLSTRLCWHGMASMVSDSHTNQSRRPEQHLGEKPHPGQLDIQ